MELLIIRHAIAKDREEFSKTGKDDSERPISDEGRHDMRRAVRGLRKMIPSLGLLASSPLVRAVQTAQLVAEVYKDDLKIETFPELAPGQPPDKLMKRLGAVKPGKGPVALVGHEPDLGSLVSWLLSGDTRSFVELKKGGMCLLESDGLPAPKETQLLWLLTPRQVRRLRKRR